MFSKSPVFNLFGIGKKSDRVEVRISFSVIILAILFWFTLGLCPFLCYGSGWTLPPVDPPLEGIVALEEGEDEPIRINWEVDQEQWKEILDEEIEAAKQYLLDYISIPSVSGNEGKAGKYLADLSESKGLFVHYFSTENDKYNFAASLYPLLEGKPNIILHHHIDVVPAEDSLSWNSPPFEGVLSDSAIHGRGALDAKGLGAMHLAAMVAFKRIFKDQDFPYNITLLAMSDEERGGRNGSRYIREYHLAFLKPLVMFGEGGSGLVGVLQSKPEKPMFGISNAEKESLWVELKLVFETFSHGATPATAYANQMMVEALSRINNRKRRLKFSRANRPMFRQLGRAEGGVRGFFIRHINWAIIAPFVKNFIKEDPLLKALMTNTITITNIQNPPGAPNIISESIVATLDCRLVPGTNRKTFLRRLEKLVDNEHIQIRIIESSPEGEISRPGGRPFKAMERSILSVYPDSEVGPFLFPATTDNTQFRAAGVPAYGIIPALLSQEELEGVHGSNELIYLETLDKGTEVYFKFLVDLQSSPGRLGKRNYPYEFSIEDQD